MRSHQCYNSHRCLDVEFGKIRQNTVKVSFEHIPLINLRKSRIQTLSLLVSLDKKLKKNVKINFIPNTCL